MNLEECKIGQQVYIRSIRDIQNEFGGNRYDVLDKFDYNDYMEMAIEDGAIGVITAISNRKIRVRSDKYKGIDWDGLNNGWWHHPETLYEIKEDTENE